ncbi:hypothetical protein NESM_000594200 [Novymonas esmeraldas]|uniref:CFA20 domain-containing protein n=1 Tax=Novymonas esmeraldas TaxID=1808958 RepID=A0AAW0ES58_9TRYP
MATDLQLVMEANSKLLTSAKVVNPRGCSIDIDKYIRRPVLIMKGTPSQTRVRIPREDRPLSSLRLHDSLLVAQICLNAMDHFALEIVVSQYTVNRTKLVIGTYVKAARYDERADELTTAYLPLIIPRNKWVQVVFHVAGIAHSVFNLPSITCIDTITLTGTGKMCCVFTSSDEQRCIDATPDGMALFAVPAYAPPIWKTAAPSPDHPPSLPTLDARSVTPLASDPPSNSALALRVESPASVTSSLSRHQVLPPRLQPLTDMTAASPSPHVPPSIGVSEQGEAPANKGVARSHFKCDYLRLVDSDDAAARDDFATMSSSYGDTQRQPAQQEGGAGRSLAALRGAVDATTGGLSGWDPPLEERTGATAATSSARTSKGDAVKRQPRKPKGAPAAPGVGDNERMQRLVASRKRRVVPRQGSLSNGGGESGRSNGSRRQQRLRRRMRVLRANEQKVNKAAAAKTLVASELPLSQHVTVAEDSTEAAPVCGYGFGYLGMLKPNGEYEEDEDANLNLRGALTLLTDGE